MYKKISSSTLLLLLSLGATNQASSAIVETGCAIGTDSHDQTINLGMLSAGQVASNSQGKAHRFSIRLMNCVLDGNDPLLADWRRFQITLDGGNDSGLFAIKGDAKAIALQLIDYKGKSATPGMPLSIIKTDSKEISLNYSLWPMANHPSLPLEEYTSAVRLKLDYY